MRNQSYPSDISRERFESIRPMLENARKQTRPRTVDLYEAFCAVLYLLRTGCQWRALPADFPKWRTVHAYFMIWSEVDEEGKSAGAGFKKIRLARPARNWGAAPPQAF